jgi:altronate dehydratase
MVASSKNSLQPVIVMNSKDNIAVCLRELSSGEKIDLRKTGHNIILTVRDQVPLGHKVALVDIGNGEPVRKYGEVIGKATQKIASGQHVHIHNLADF